MADEASVKLMQITPKSEKKDGFNLVTENVTAIDMEAKQIEFELLAYDGRTVLLDVSDEALEDLKKLSLVMEPRSVWLRKMVNGSLSSFAFGLKIPILSRSMRPFSI